jgi:tetratricopeptide (TPR) repeat protein
LQTALLLVLLIVGASTAGSALADSNSSEASPKDGGIPEVELSGALMYQLLAAEASAQQGDFGTAYSIYLKLGRETRDARLARRATELALQGRAMPQAVEAAETWRELAPRSTEAAQTLALLYVGSNRFDEAMRLYEQQLKLSPKPAVDLGSIERQLARTQDKARAFELLERLAQPYLADAEVRVVLANGAHAAGMSARAAQEARAAVELAPDSERAVLTAAQYLQSTDRAAALSILERYVARPGASSEAKLAYARLLVADRQYERARSQFQLLVKDDPDSADLVYALALLSLQANHRTEARDYLQRYLVLVGSDSERGPEQAYLYLAQIEEDEKQYAQALQWLRKIAGGDEYVTARVREAGVLAKMQRLDEARKLLRSINAQGDERVQLLLAEAHLLREARRYDESYKLLVQALASSPDNVALLYDTAMAAEKLDRVDAMEKNLRRVIELKPDYAHAYNALGYSLADRNLRLTEALQLIEKANQLAPADPYILDSMGWVYFRLGRLKEARGYLEQAYSAKPEAEVMVHLAEVLWATGDQAGARKLLREARTLEPNNDLLKSTLARLRIGL